MARTLDRLTLLNAIFNAFQMVTQAPDDNVGTRYYDKAESLIEVLEVFDCGSVGGYDSTNPNKRVTGCRLFDRFLTLLRKENGAEIEPSCGANVDTLAHYFTQLMDLRDKVYEEFPA